MDKMKNFPRQNFQSFLLGLLTNFFLYLFIVYFKEKLILNILLPIPIGIALMGFLAGNIYVKSKIYSELFLICSLLINYFSLRLTYSTFYNFDYIYFPKAIPEIYVPFQLFSFSWLVSYVYIFAYLGNKFIILFNDIKEKKELFVFYSLNVYGFLAGSLLPFIFIPIIGPNLLWLCGSLLLLVFIKRNILKLAYVSLIVLISLTFINKKDIFFIFEIKSYKKLGTYYSPYFKVDFITYEKGCLGGLYNNFLMWDACKDTNKDYLVRRKLFSLFDKNMHDFLFIGASAGNAVKTLYDMHKNTNKIVAIEIDPTVVNLMKGKFASYNNNIYNHPKVKVFAAEGRVFMENDSNRYDVIYYDGIDTPFLNFAFTNITMDNYLHTSEAYELVFNKLLKKDGLFLVEVGGSNKESTYQFIKSFPKEVYYDVYWWINTDYPFVGIPLYWIVATKSLKTFNTIKKSMQSVPVEYISMDEIKRGRIKLSPVFDDKPFITQGLFVIAIPFAFVLLIFTLVFMRKIKKMMIIHKINTYNYFALWAGIGYSITQLWIIAKFSRIFLAPVFGSTFIISLYLLGGTIMHFVFPFLNQKNKNFLVYLLLGLFVLTNLLMKANNVMMILWLTFLSGIIWAFFWDVGISQTKEIGRYFFYIIETFGMIAGILIFQILVVSMGFHKTFIFVLFIMIYLVFSIIFRGKEIDNSI